MESGWVKLHRKMLWWEWYDDIHVFRVFIHLLLNANHKPKKWHGIMVDTGQKITSLGHLSRELKMGVQVIRTALAKLKSTNEITIETTSQYTKITILRWNDYQTETSDLTNEQQTTNKRLTTNKNDKNDKNEKKRDISKTAIEDVITYFKEKGYTETSARKFFDYYSVADWKDSTGKPVKNWKQKAQAVWFKEENKEKKPTTKTVEQLAREQGRTI